MSPANSQISQVLRTAYSQPGWVGEYARYTHLQPPEETILRLLLPDLPAARMLDLGVGGGRTTLHFAKWVREYLGTDFSENMVLACRQRFAGYPPHISFAVCDARNMEMFEAASFDFILFSFNGIDSVSHDDRLKVLREVRRVGKPGGYFCFSSHNLNTCADMFELRRMVSLNPRLAVRTAKRLLLRFRYNASIPTATARNSEHLVMNTSISHPSRVPNYFIRPLAQLAQLQQDFTGVRVFSTSTGAEIQDRSELETIQDPWLYYLCKLK